ncbi:MAG: hypothetical protein GTO18_21865 [Anaerolineales bacterium]|nr:hypothetical protein [Anaerolineales bacterium]
MNNIDLSFIVAEARRKELMKEAELYRQLKDAQHRRPSYTGLKIAWALVGPVMAIVVLSLVF